MAAQRGGLEKARRPILGLTAFVCAGIVFALLFEFGAIASDATETVGLALICGAVAYWLLRSASLALLAAAVPIITAVFALGVLTPLAASVPLLCDVLIPHAVVSVLLAEAAVTLIVLYGFQNETCRGTPSDTAGWLVVQRLYLPVALALTTVAGWRVLLLLPDWSVLTARRVAATDYSAVGSIVTGLFAALVIFLFVPITLAGIKVTEGAIADANRRREWWERMISPIEFAAEFRWAFSFLGISAILLALAVFSRPSAAAIWQVAGLLFPIVLGVPGLIAVLAMRDWRLLISVAVPAGLAATLGAEWTSGVGATTGFGPVFLSWTGGAPLLLPVAAVTAAASLLLALRISRHQRFGDPVALAFTPALKEVGLPIVWFALALLVATAPLGLWPLALVSATAALVLTPALITVLENVAPVRKTIEELYAAGKIEPF